MIEWPGREGKRGLGCCVRADLGCSVEFHLDNGFLEGGFFFLLFGPNNNFQNVAIIAMVDDAPIATAAVTAGGVAILNITFIPFF